MARCQSGDRTVAQVARDFDLTETAVRAWVHQAEVDTGKRDGLTSSERDELTVLRRENRRLQADVDLLKRATVSSRRRPVKMDPFIEAEKVTGHSVKHCCELFKVSKSAYYQRKQDQRSTREISDTALIERMVNIHTTSEGTYGSPRMRQQLVADGVDCGRRRVRRLMRRAGLEGRCKKRWRRRPSKTRPPKPRRWT